jgi:hypothetical protein
VSRGGSGLRLEEVTQEEPCPCQECGQAVCPESARRCPRNPGTLDNVSGK